MMKNDSKQEISSNTRKRANTRESSFSLEPDVLVESIAGSCWISRISWLHDALSAVSMVLAYWHF